MGAGARRLSILVRLSPDVVDPTDRDADLGGDCYLYSSGMPCWAQNAGVRVH